MPNTIIKINWIDSTVFIDLLFARIVVLKLETWNEHLLPVHYENRTADVNIERWYTKFK